MLTDEKILLLLAKLADGESGLRSFFYGLGFDAQSSPLPIAQDEDWARALHGQPRLIAIEDHSRLAALWFPLRNLSDDVQKRIRRHYGARFPAALFLFSGTKNETWAWEFSTPGATASCRFHLDQVANPLLRAVRILYLADDEYLDIHRIEHFAQVLNVVGLPELPVSLSSKAAWTPLTSEEERELARRIAQGGADGLSARNTLVEANIRLVTANAKRYLYCGMDMEDLIQEGTLGLIHAAEKFDGRRGYRFSTYATHWVRQALGRAAENKALPIRIPSYLVEVVAKILRETQRLKGFLEREPDIEELAAATNLPLQSIRRGLNTLQLQPQTLDYPVPGTTLWLRDVVSAPAHFQPEQLAAAGATHEAIEQAFELLSKREKEVLVLRYGFDQPSMGGRTLEEVGQALQVSRERVRQIEAGALQKLREKSAGACLRATVLGLDEELTKPTSLVAGATHSSKTRAITAKPPIAFPQEIQQALEENQEPEPQELEQPERVLELVVPEVTTMSTLDLELTLFSGEQLHETTLPAPEVQRNVEPVCEECGFPVEIKPTLGGRFYRCKNCKNIGQL